MINNTGFYIIHSKNFYRAQLGYNKMTIKLSLRYYVCCNFYFCVNSKTVLSFPFSFVHTLTHTYLFAEQVYILSIFFQYFAN